MIWHRFPIFILQSILLFVFLSCDKNQLETPIDIAKYNASLDKGELYTQQQQYDSAFYYFNQAKLAAADTENTDRIVFALIRMSAVQQISSDFSGSEVTATEAVSYLKNSTVQAYPAIIYNTLGIAYKGQSDFENAVRYYSQSSQYTADPLYKVILKNNIAVVYLEKKDFKKAISFLEPLLQNPALLKDSLNLAKVIDNLGYAFLKTVNPKALACLNTSLNIREKMGNDYELVSVYLHLAEYYQKTDKELSNAYACKAYRSATNINNPDDRIETLKMLVNYTSGEESKKYALIHMNLTDSIGKIRQSAKNQFAKIRYDDAKTKEENTGLKYQKERMTYSIIILAGLVVILILFVFIIRYRRKTRHEREKLEAAHNAEIHISRKIHDELANDLYNTITFTETQDLAETTKKEILLRHLDSVYERARDISRENSTINTGSDFAFQLRDMLTEYSSSRQKVILHGLDSMPWNTMYKEKKIILYRILQELMVNMKKHSGAGFAMIRFEIKEKNVVINYSDNGVGTDKTNLFSKNGLQNVENRINAINGTFTFDSEPENGLRITLTCPLEN